MKVTHIITGLNVGGAEMMLYKLLSEMDHATFQLEVISLTDIGSLGQKIQHLCIPVRSLNMSRSMPNPLAIPRLRRWLRQSTPDLIQTWMYHADLIGGFAAKLAGNFPVVWNLRQSTLDAKDSKRSTFWTVKLCALLSHWLPNYIVCGSESAQHVHRALGYAEAKMVVIPNGFDVQAFKPDLAARGSVRHDLGLPEKAILIGMVGRFDPQKDHHNFVQAAEILYNLSDFQSFADILHFVLVGQDITYENTQLIQWLDAAGIRDRCHLLGQRTDIPRLTASFDIASLTSGYGEGFPNVIGEAMACGVPCTVTDVGDSAAIVGSTGRVVPPHNPQSLAVAWRELIELGPNERERLGAAARHRVQQHFSLPDIVRLYEALYFKMVSKAATSKVSKVDW